jgi:probable rRNA maturation factor
VRIELRDLQSMAVSRQSAETALSLTAEEVPSDCACVSLVFVDDARMHELNRRFRGVDAPTDVISFGVEEDDEERTGEIVISTDTALRQVQESGRTLDREIAWLVSHGMLHIAGMDDETEEDLEQMLVIQRRILARMFGER